MRKLILMGVVGLMACQSSQEVTYPPVPMPDRPFLYPSWDQRDAYFLCNSVYRIPQFPSKPYVGSATPQLLFVTENTITIFFSNDYTQTVARPSTVKLRPGNYPCQ